MKIAFLLALAGGFLGGDKGGNMAGPGRLGGDAGQKKGFGQTAEPFIQGT